MIGEHPIDVNDVFVLGEDFDKPIEFVITYPRSKSKTLKFST